MGRKRYTAEQIIDPQLALFALARLAITKGLKPPLGSCRPSQATGRRCVARLTVNVQLCYRLRWLWGNQLGNPA
jgi:hypothetical protein